MSFHVSTGCGMYRVGGKEKTLNERPHSIIMAIKKSTVLSVLFLIFVLSSETNLVKIHRASPRNSKAKLTENNGWLSFCSHLPDFSNLFSKNKEAWLYSLPCTILVGLCGVFPILVIPVESGHALREGVTADHLRLLLSFAVGGLLGDVFLHLLPEAWSKGEQDNPHAVNFAVGFWVLAGIILFFVLENIFDDENKETDENNKKEKVYPTNEHKTTQNGILQKINKDNKYCNHKLEAKNGQIHTNAIRQRENKVQTKTDSCQNQSSEVQEAREPEHKVIGYLNLFANIIDNFTHGLAVAGSFVVSKKVGLCTTCAILLHEIPHEIGDFAILIKSGFNKKDAAIGQMVTASGGLAGAIVGLIADHAGDQTAWILPFSSGGFIYIAMVTIIPELLEEKRPRESIKQVLMMIAGIASMALVSLVH